MGLRKASSRTPPTHLPLATTPTTQARMMERIWRETSYLDPRLS